MEHLGARARGARIRRRRPDLRPVEAGIEATRLVDYRTQVLHWCRGVGVPLILIGASLGGLLALSVANEAGASALVLVNPLPPSGLAGHSKSWPAVIPWARERALANTRRALTDADDAACLYAFRRWRDESGAVLDEACAGTTAEPLWCPVLLFAGEDDEDVPAVAGQSLR